MTDQAIIKDDQVKRVVSELCARHEGEEIRYTNCWQNGKCFGANCVVKWRIKDGKPIAVEPDDTIHPESAREDFPEDIERGLIQGRPCEIAHAFIGSINNPNRLLYPMKRVGERGEGKWEQISWDEAVDTIATKIRETLDKYGPYSIYNPESAFDNSSFPVGPYLKAGFCAHGSVSYDGPLLAIRQWMGHDHVADFRHQDDKKYGVSGYEAPDLFNSKLIVLWGWSAFARDYQYWPYYIKLARERDIPVICVDPIYNWTAEILADQHIPIRPGTDLAMMLAVAYILIDEDLYDHAYTEKWIDPVGFEKFKDYVLGNDGSGAKTPEWAEAKCGVPAETIRGFAHLYADSKPTHLHFCLSCGRQHRGEYQTAIAIILQAMTGNTATHGGYHAALDFGLPMRFPMVPIPGVMFQRAASDYKPPSLLFVTEWHNAILLHDDLESGKLSLDEYNRLIGNDPGNPAPNIKMMFFLSNNANNHYEVNKRIEAIKKLDFCFGFHYSLEQTVARYMDIVLPAAYIVETNDDWVNRELQFPISPFQVSLGALGNTLSYAAKLFDAPGNIRDRDWFWTQIANKLGIGELYNPHLKDVPWEYWSAAVEGMHKAGYDMFINTPGIADVVGGAPTWEEFKQKPIFRVPIEDPHYAYQEMIEAGENPYHTPSGKIEPYATDNETIGETWHGGHMDPLPKWEVDYMDEPPYQSFYHPKAHKYPLNMVTPVSSYRQHSLHDNNPRLRDEVYRHAFWISVPDAKKRGIKDGDMVRVFNDIGEVRLPAYVTARMTPGVAAMFHGSWYTPGDQKTDAMPEGIDERGACNLLITGETVPHVISAFYTNGLVEAEKLED